MKEAFRIEKDSMGEVKVPKDALYAAQTQRAVENFPVSGIPLRRPLLAALGLITSSAARVNGASGALPEEVAALIHSASQEVIEGKLDEHFPIDIYQTGSGTSSNMDSRYRSSQPTPHPKKFGAKSQMPSFSPTVPEIQQP